MRSIRLIKKRIAELENLDILQEAQANIFTKSRLAINQIELKSELDGLYFSLGKSRPYYPADDIAF